MKRLLLALNKHQSDAVRANMRSDLNLEIYDADTAELALKLHRDKFMDVIFADLELPEMGGDNLCSHIRADSDRHKVYFVILCEGRKPELRLCGKCGADTYITKPIDPAVAATRLGGIIEMSAWRATRVLVKVQVHGTIESEPFFCVSRNLSITGILLETERTLAKGDLIECSFFLPDRERINVPCRVMRVDEKCDDVQTYGVEFTSIDEHGRTLIEDFINQERSVGNFQ